LRLSDDNSALQEDGARLVHQRRPLANQSLSRSVQSLNVELILALQLDEPHGRTRRRLGDSLRVAVIVLLRLDVGPNVFRRHQADVMSMGRKNAANVMGAAAGFHRYDAGRKLRRQPDQRLALDAPPQHNRSAGIDANQTARILAEVDPKNRNCHRHNPFLLKPTARLRRWKEGRAIP